MSAAINPVWRGQTIANLLAASEMTMDEAGQLIIVKSAARDCWAWDSLPDADQMIQLLDDLRVPFHLGETITKVCQDRVLDAIRNLVTRDKLGNGLVTARRGKRKRQMSRQDVLWSEALRQQVIAAESLDAIQSLHVGQRFGAPRCRGKAASVPPTRKELTSRVLHELRRQDFFANVKNEERRKLEQISNGSKFRISFERDDPKTPRDKDVATSETTTSVDSYSSSDSSQDKDGDEATGHEVLSNELDGMLTLLRSARLTSDNPNRLREHGYNGTSFDLSGSSSLIWTQLTTEEVIDHAGPRSSSYTLAGVDSTSPGSDDPFVDSVLDQRVVEPQPTTQHESTVSSDPSDNDSLDKRPRCKARDSSEGSDFDGSFIGPRSSFRPATDPELVVEVESAGESTSSTDSGEGSDFDASSIGPRSPFRPATDPELVVEVESAGDSYSSADLGESGWQRSRLRWREGQSRTPNPGLESPESGCGSPRQRAVSRSHDEVSPAESHLISTPPPAGALGVTLHDPNGSRPGTANRELKSILSPRRRGNETSRETRNLRSVRFASKVLLEQMTQKDSE